MRISDWSSDVCSSDLLEGDDDTRAVILVEWRRLGEAPRPFRVLDRAHLAPEAHGVRPRRALRRVARLVVPGAVLQGHGEDVHDGMVEGLAARPGIVLLRVAGTGAHDQEIGRAHV